MTHFAHSPRSVQVCKLDIVDLPRSRVEHSDLPHSYDRPHMLSPEHASATIRKAVTSPDNHHCAQQWLANAIEVTDLLSFMGIGIALDFW